MQEQIQSLCDTIEKAYADKQALSIIGGSSKAFYGNQIDAATLSIKELTGIIEYEPSELYITAYAGTPLSVIEQALAEKNQMFSFEPPSYSASTTLGGVIASGFSGPRRPYADALRDCVLGTNIINGKGEHLSFGGKVMKNVAGYDVSRLMCAAFGTLGVITQASIKVLPKPKHEITLSYELNQADALQKIHQWLNASMPITASYFADNRLNIRLSGLENTLSKIHNDIGGEINSSSAEFWQSVKNHQTDFFNTDLPLWRCIIPQNIENISIEGDSCFEWNGGLRWIKSTTSAEKVFEVCHSLKGHASLFRSTDKPKDCLAPMNSELKKLHTNLKHAFDPAKILNPGRMYSWC